MRGFAILTILRMIIGPRSFRVDTVERTLRILPLLLQYKGAFLFQVLLLMTVRREGRCQEII